MRIACFGATGEVTGSCHLLEWRGHRVLLECGLVQGGHEERARNAEEFPFDVGSLDAVVISHAHIDHIGRLPLLLRRGYQGPVYLQRASADLARVMLDDSAMLAEKDAESQSRRLREQGLPPVAPLYAAADVHDTARAFRALDYGRPQEILPGLTLTLHDAGHILGSAIVELRGDDGRTLVFSGDVGPRSAPFLPDPTPLARADLLLLESTYGDRNHRSRAATVRELGEILGQAHRDGGNVLIPAFAVGRTQELLYWFARHYDDWGLDRWDIVLDSPMAVRVIEVYRRHAAQLEDDAARLLQPGRRPFDLPNLRLVSQVQDSMALNRRGAGMVVIAGSGMCNGGRIRHHLKHNLWRESCDVVFVGYQAKGTLGRALVDGAEFVDIGGDRVRVRARSHTVGGLSAHADQDGLARWFAHFDPPPRTRLVHGEDGPRAALAQRLGASGADVAPAEYGVWYEV